MNFIQIYTYLNVIQNVFSSIFARKMCSDVLFCCLQVWDVTMQDLCSGSMTLDLFRAVVFVGGFSYADVLGSAKGEPYTQNYTHIAKDTTLMFTEMMK